MKYNFKTLINPRKINNIIIYAKNSIISFCTSSKMFNLTSLIKNILNKKIRNIVRQNSKNNHYNNINVLSTYALIGLYSNEDREDVFK